jgi:hypothetical protein
MKYLHGGVLAALLLSPLATPAFAACVNAKCSDAASIEKARGMIQTTCGCTREGQKHGTYEKCVKSTLKLADLTALIPEKACRKLIMKCEAASTCGKLTSAVCCVAKNNGKVKASIVKSATKCKKGSTCGAFLGFYSTFDACAADGTCAGPPTTTTTLASTPTTTLPGNPTTTTIPPPGGSVLKGALLPTPGRFNYNAKLGLPGANDACATNFPGTHACTFAELKNAEAAGDLVGLKDTGSNPVTSFWAIDSGQPALQQCNDDAANGSGLNWEYATAHTASRGQKVTLDASGALGPLQSGLQCNFSGNSSVGCCQ